MVAAPTGISRAPAGAHIPVLLREAVQALAVQPGGHYVDGTFGRGGHSSLILQGLQGQGALWAFDKDPAALAFAAQDERFNVPTLHLQQGSFVAMQDLAAQSLDGILLDLGVSSAQIDDGVRGFSFQLAGPLDMRMDPTQGLSVAQWLAQADEQSIREVIYEYGEERYAGAVAKAICAWRANHGAIADTLGLAQIVASAVKTREPGKNPATRTFQAFRIFINHELDDLQRALFASLTLLKPHGRLVVISFHSLEDRIVKRFMQQHGREHVERGSAQAQGLVSSAPALPLRILGRMRACPDEVAANARARSAIMRIAQRTQAPCSAAQCTNTNAGASKSRKATARRARSANGG